MYGVRSGKALVAGLIALILAAGCKSGTETSVDVQSFITALTTSSGTAAAAAFHSGSAPSQGSGPSLTSSGTTAFVPGGSAIRTLTSGTAFTRVIVTVQGYDGYWELTLASSTTTLEIIITLAQSIPSSSFTLRYAGGTSAGIGSYNSEAVSVVSVGTGDIQVSVSWDAESDVDLHVVEPSGEETYYGHRTSSTGAQLDLDSNAGCSIDHTKVENITWPSTTPPHGTYVVRVDYWSSCSVSQTNYVVTVRVKGHSTQTYTGSFTGSGDSGGQGSGTQVATFTY